MSYKSGDFLELPNGRSVRLNKDTAEIANAAKRAAEWNPEEALEHLGHLKEWKRGEEAPLD